MGKSAVKPLKKLSFVDAFAGCGGLSLGLMQAGLKGLFAIERDENAFETLKANLLVGGGPRFKWPRWLPKASIAIEDLLRDHREELVGLRGKVDILVGGPPCQGFSSAGRRKHDDPRNKLFASYFELVKLLQPRAVLIENVRGFTMDFARGEDTLNYAQRLRTLLSADYEVHEELFDLSQFGVPQSRTRYFLLAFKPGVAGDGNPFDSLRDLLPSHLRSLGLRVPVSSRLALSDLEIGRAGKRPSRDTTGFDEIGYSPPQTSYQKLMAKGTDRTSDLRLARHAPEISRRFAEIIELSHAEGRLNTAISEEMRDRYGIRKRALRVLDPDRPSPTVTSMPDDLLHYSEPRTLTVRENARLQGFPDWFSFHGKYTTGGLRRAKEVPRFTQVANAVPPIVALAFGRLLRAILIPTAR